MTKRNETVLITGGTRGLGLAIAEIYAKRGMNIAVCSRTEVDLDKAVNHLLPFSPRIKVKGYVCDVGNEEEVLSLLEKISHDFGIIDILVNNAGVIISAPALATSVKDMKSTMDSNLLGMIHTSMALAPKMAERRAGRIINVASIGGVVPVPHLLAYGTSKFGAVGFSTSLGLELKRFDVSVTTVCPTLIRTGSYLHALFKGKTKQEMNWFTVASTYPFLSKSAESVAAAIVRAGDRRKLFAVIGLNAKIARLGFALFPNLTLSIMDRVNRLLPAEGTHPNEELEKFRQDDPLTGAEVIALTGIHPETKAGADAATRWNERNGC
ncbi:MAG: SDR family oxidoreductase [Cryobacterium sp.]|nr:SDR family oxidoreductase [Oligoflexia bacterium]